MGRGSPSGALGEIVKAHAGIYESDSPEVATEKLEAVLPESEDRPWLRACLLPLLGVESNQASQEELFTAWRRFLESVAERDPLALVLEDIHWADGAMADWAEGVPLLVVCTARPELYESKPTWGAGLRNATTISLSPLSDTDTARLVSGLLEQSVLPAETQQLLLERAGGNPLYAEEFVRMLRDRDLLDGHGTLKTDAQVPFPDSIQALIAARLDTLSQDRKQLLQDAAVMGKVFWAGSTVAMGERDPSEVEQALHELSRKELVRLARQSSMEGEAEYGFWHVLVRDVAYGQIPRAGRAAKHIKATNWLEQKAGERVEDLADVLAHHTGEALTLAQAAGDTALQAEVTPSAARYALLAGERALGLDTTKALSLLERAMQLTPVDDPHQPQVLARFAAALFQAGRLEEAVATQTRVVATLRERGDQRGTGEALTSLMLYECNWTGNFTGEAVALLETQPPGPELVAAYEQMAGDWLVRGAHDDALAASERSLALASDLDLPVPGRALGFHGSARCLSGDPDGLEELEQARTLLLASGRGRDAVIATLNLGITRWTYEGPAVAIARLEEAQALAAQRGLTTARLQGATASFALLIEMGRLGDVLRIAHDLADAIEALRMPMVTIEHQAATARALYEQGDTRAAATASQRALAVARELNLPIPLLIAGLPTAQCAVATGDQEAAAAVLGELLQWSDRIANEDYVARLPALIRCALAAGDAKLAAGLIEGVEQRLPMYEHALLAARAQLAAAGGEHGDAADQFYESGECWQRFGATLEQAYALLGEGRCLTLLGDPQADQSLRRARALFDTMGARPRLNECDTLIAQASKLTS
jgi:tetratricopeptide (TPR) repeat protein